MKGIKEKGPHLNEHLSYNDFCPSILEDNSADLLQKMLQNVSDFDSSLSVRTGGHLSSEVGTFNRSKCAKGSKSSLIPKILKHYIHKQTSFNNVWTALVKSELNGVCDHRIPLSDSFRNNTIKHSVSVNNPDLLEVYSSKIQVPEDFSKSVNSPSPSKGFNTSKSSTSIAKTSRQQGFSCKADLSPKDHPEIFSPISVSSEESVDLSEVDPKLDSEFEGRGLIVLFNEEGFLQIIYHQICLKS